MPTRRTQATFEEADIALEQALDELDASVPNYNEWLRLLVGPASRGRVLEVGAGVGTFTLALLKSAQHVVAVEPSERGSAALRLATNGDERVTVVHGYIADAVACGPFDGAVLSNVLEHIENAQDTLRDLAAVVRPGGCVAVFSPAFQLLMSDFDRSIGHVRRYRKPALRVEFERAGFEIVDARYVNLPGFFAWLLVARILRRRPTDSTLSRFYDRFVVPPTRWIESHVSPPFGQSVLVIGRLPMHANSPQPGL